MPMSNRRLKTILISVMVLLLVPLVSMQFTDQVNWGPLDFVVAGVMLLAAGLVFDLVLRKIKNKNYRIIIIITLLLVFLLIWAELAVGVFGTPLSGN